MPVLDKDYLVGRVVETNYLSSRVLLLSDLNSRIPVTLPLFIAMTALARMIILQGKEPSDLLYEAGAIVLVAIACLIIRTRPPEKFRANVDE